jgi:hypothetical protein
VDINCVGSELCWGWSHVAPTSVKSLMNGEMSEEAPNECLAPLVNAMVGGSNVSEAGGGVSGSTWHARAAAAAY